MKWRHHLFPVLAALTGHLSWRLKLFSTKPDCTKTLVGVIRESLIPVVLGPKVVAEEGEEMGLCGSPHPAELIFVLPTWAMAVPGCFWSCVGHTRDVLLKEPASLLEQRHLSVGSLGCLDLQPPLDSGKWRETLKKSVMEIILEMSV